MCRLKCVFQDAVVFTAPPGKEDMEYLLWKTEACMGLGSVRT